MYSQTSDHSAFCPFDESEVCALNAGPAFSLDNGLHPLGLLAAEKLQQYLQEQQAWQHNFGLTPGVPGAIIGKMFGVLAVRTEQGQLGYLAAFSGKLAGGNHHTGFVPPIFDGVAEGGFLNAGMKRLSRINAAISTLEQLCNGEDVTHIGRLKTLRKNHSISLQHKIFAQYHFLNRAGQSKSLIEIFKGAKNPPAGAGECAAPKLLQYAFLHNMEPLALAEFWWGLSPKSASWKHGQFYAPCREKCAPILAHMLN